MLTIDTTVVSISPTFYVLAFLQRVNKNIDAHCCVHSQHTATPLDVWAFTYWDTCELHAIMRTHRNSIYLVYRHRSNLAPYNGCWFLKFKIINRMDTAMFGAPSTWPYVVKCEPHFLPGDMRITLRCACTTQWNLIYRFYRHKLNLAYKLLMMSNQLKRATALSCALIHPTD